MGQFETKELCVQCYGIYDFQTSFFKSSLLLSSVTNVGLSSFSVKIINHFLYKAEHKDLPHFEGI